MNLILHILKLRHVPQRLMTLRYLVTHPPANTYPRPTPHLTFLTDFILRMALNGKALLPHFADSNTEAQRLEGHTQVYPAGKWPNQKVFDSLSSCFLTPSILCTQTASILCGRQAPPDTHLFPSP